jgi:hypothetical protein
MNRLLVTLLSALDAAIAAVIGAAAAVVPLAALWLFGMHGASWGGLWPTAATIWQLGHLVPITVHLPGEYLSATGIPSSASTFVLSLAPLAFTVFTAIFAARSGGRAVRAGDGVVGVAAGAAAFAVLAGLIAATSRTGIATVNGWLAVFAPALVFLVGGLLGALGTAWREGDGGPIDALRERIDDFPARWGLAPSAVLRGSAIALVGLLMLGALGVGVDVLLHGGRIIALYEAGNMSIIGVIMTSLGQLAYLPTMIVWALAYVAGPGILFGASGSVTPAGTQLGIVPGIPALGALPQHGSPWLLVLVLLPVAVGAAAGHMIRVRMADDDGTGEDAPFSLRAVTAIGIALVSAGGTAVLAAVAAGSMGPGRLAAVGPVWWAAALAVGAEVLIGSAILLLGPRSGSAKRFD